jgi:hypothetical protein
MSVQNYNDLVEHLGHNLTVALYGNGINATIECVDCYDILLDYDREREGE